MSCCTPQRSCAGCGFCSERLLLVWLPLTCFAGPYQTLTSPKDCWTSLFPVSVRYHLFPSQVPARTKTAMSDPASPLSPPGVDGAPASGAPPPGPPPGMPNNLFEAKPLTNHHSTMLGVTIPFMVFCWLAVCGRLGARCFVTRNPWWDDVLVVLSMVSEVYLLSKLACMPS